MDRKIKYIVLHCTATDQSVTVQAISNYWRDRLKWKNPGYHFIIEADGKTTQLLDINRVANGVKGYNSNSIHVSYIGGKYGDNRTREQKIALEGIVKALHGIFPDAEIKGHKDFPGVKKSCPNFNVSDWLESIDL